MKKFLKFQIKGLPLSIPISIIALMGTNGGSSFEVQMVWIAMAIGLPWNIPSLAAIAVAILSHGINQILGLILLFGGLAWTFFAINLNCALLMALLQKAFSLGSSSDTTS